MITLNSSVGNYIRLKNERYSYFAGNNYLGLANHPDVVKDSVLALQKYGVNFSASRQTTGTSDLHLKLEKLLAEFKAKESAITFASGYMGNRLLLEQLKHRYSVIYVDSMAHASITDGIPGMFSNIVFFRHRDPDNLEEILERDKEQQPIVVTDGIFSLTGEIAPLDRIYPLVRKHNGLLLVDDAHATGVLGPNGRGTPDYFGLDGAPGIYQSETMSKALGAYGGFIAGSEEFIGQLRGKSSFYQASTSLPPSIVAAACSSLKLIKGNPQWRNVLLKNSEHLRNGIIELGFDTSGSNTPIVPVYFSEQQTARDLSAYLEENLIIAPAVDYPVKMEKFIVRITVSAIHTEDQIENLLDILKNWRDSR